MTATQAPPIAAARGTPSTELLRAFLESYWLRPENALWMSLRSQVLSSIALPEPVADLACGDGVFMFLHRGGRFDPAFDVFHAVDKLDHVTFQHADMFDCARGYEPAIRRPAEAMEFGLDLKPALLAKAAALAAHRRLAQHDLNLRLPFEDEELGGVYCNSAYWLREVDSFLIELGRVVRRGSPIVLHVKLAHMDRFTLKSHRAVLGEAFIDIIERGRRECWPTVKSRAGWERSFERAGLHICSVSPIASRTHAYAWDIGLRPIAPLLVRMTQSLNSTAREAIKRDWVALFMELLQPLAHPELDLLPGDDSPAELQYVLTR